jgi:membrane protein DedA with SNARE-associated domain
MTDAFRAAERTSSSWGLAPEVHFVADPHTLTTMPALRSLWLDLLSAVLWSTTVALAGFIAGRLVMRRVDDLHRYEMPIVIAVLAIGLVVAIRYPLKPTA